MLIITGRCSKITAKALSENVSYALKYSAEMMYESKLEDTKRLKQIITESKAGLINSMISDPLLLQCHVRLVIFQRGHVQGNGFQHGLLRIY